MTATLQAQQCFARSEPLCAYLENPDYVSSSELRRFERLGYVASRPSSTDSGTTNVMGEALHALVLEPESFVSRYGFEAHTDDEQEMQRSRSRRKPLDAWQWTALHHARDALFDCQDSPVATWMQSGRKELSIYWRDSKANQWKARPDCFTPEIVLDLKTTTDCRAVAFRRTRARLLYDIQAAHYIEAVSRLTGTEPRFAYVAVELSQPYSVAVHELDSEEISLTIKWHDSLKQRYVSTAKARQRRI